MARAITACLAITLAWGCTETVDPLAGLTPWSDAWIAAHADRYLDDEGARRVELERSLTTPENLYSSTRLGTYGLGTGGWDALPVWMPRSVPIDDAIVAAYAAGERPEVPADAPLLWDGERPDSFEGWAALGERVFFELPLRSERVWEVALEDGALAAELGIERAPDGSRPGLVLLRDVDGSSAVGITCALCHSRVEGSGALAGRARRSVDYGRVRIEYADAHGVPLDESARARYASWGPGRADVSEEVSDTPIAIPDLWGLRERRYLTQCGTLTQGSPISLAIRQETQYIQANHHLTRPPRELAFALAVYLYSIETPRAEVRADPVTLARGEGLFGRECASCHSHADGSGDLVPLAVIGTDPELGASSARGTGAYRPAPLLGVGAAAPYLHHGAVDSLESMLDPAREEPGHRFGVGLPEMERSDLIAYLRSL